MLLAIDTTTSTASLALYDLSAGQLLVETTWQARRRQTQDLLPMAQQLLAQVERTPQQITALAVTTGPGSFTGVRIGISTVKGIAVGLPAPPKVIGVPTLNVTAAPWQSLQQEVLVYPFIQAGRGRYNWVHLTTQPDQRRLGVSDHFSGTVIELVADLETLESQICWLIGEVTQEVRDAVQRLPQVRLIEDAFAWRRAGWLAQVASAYFAKGEEDDLGTLQPLYLRAP